MDIPGQLNVTPAEEEIEPLLELTPALVQKRRSQGRIIFDRFIRNRAALVGAAVLILMFLFCFLGPVITGHNQPDVIHPTDASQAPSLTYPFGTDDVGRDQFARAMAGGQVSLLVGLSSMLAAIVFGIGIGSLAGFYGGVVDNVLMRLTDVVLAVPLYLLLFVLSATFSDGSPRSVIFLLAARTIGARNFRIMFRHILPNAAGPIIVNATLLVGANIILESVLSYFGFGLHPPTSSWGNMIADGQALYELAPWLVFAPGLLIFVTVLSFNLVGDGLRDALDPYMTER